MATPTVVIESSHSTRRREQENISPRDLLYIGRLTDIVIEDNCPLPVTAFTRFCPIFWHFLLKSSSKHEAPVVALLKDPGIAAPSLALVTSGAHHPKE